MRGSDEERTACPCHLRRCSALALFSPSLSSGTVSHPRSQKLNMGSYLGVAACSEEPPKFIHLTYKPQGEVKKRIALIGKGLTFDSGGYNLKVAGSMIEMMKFDMGGAGAVFGAAKIISELKASGPRGDG